jgi:predicted O-methyltransferase YrrM
MEGLENTYKILCEQYSDIHEHLPTLRLYASKSARVCELGVRGVVSTVALAAGLADSPYVTNEDITPSKKLYLYDILSDINLDKIEEGAFSKGIDIIDHFGQNDLDAEDYGDKYDMLFIDTAHNYPHCYEELCKFGKNTEKYILLHDTTIDGIRSEYMRLGYESQHYESVIKYYKEKYGVDKYEINDLKKGLSFAVERWLRENPEWKIRKVYTNNNGLTILHKPPDGWIDPEES